MFCLSRAIIVKYDTKSFGCTRTSTYEISNGERNQDKRHNFTFYNTLFTLNPVCGLLPTDHETARPFYGCISYILDNYINNQLQVTNIVSFPLCLTSSRTYSINARTLSSYYPKPGYSRTIRPTSEARLFPNYLATIRSLASPRLSDRHPKPGLLPDYPTTIRSRAIP